jgi:hypothetical protein
LKLVFHKLCYLWKKLLKLFRNKLFAITVITSLLASFVTSSLSLWNFITVTSYFFKQSQILTCDTIDFNCSIFSFSRNKQKKSSVCFGNGRKSFLDGSRLLLLWMDSLLFYYLFCPLTCVFNFLSTLWLPLLIITITFTVTFTLGSMCYPIRAIEIFWGGNTDIYVSRCWSNCQLV